MDAIEVDRDAPSGDLRDRLSSAGLLNTTRVAGVVVWGRSFTTVVEALSLTIDRLFGVGLESLRLSPVMPRVDLEQIGYIRNFPHLLGTIHCFCGDDAGHRDLIRRHDRGEEWAAANRASDLVLTPAACYPVYALLAARGTVPKEGYHVQLRSYCFRREPSKNISRLQSFQMQEFVRIGDRSQVVAFRSAWLDHGSAFFKSLGIAAQIEVANDPFFGRAAGLMVRDQRLDEMKYELSAPIDSGADRTACMSFNYHRDHLSHAIGLKASTGTVVETACVGFGLERTALALFHRYGEDIAHWPQPIRDLLGID